MNKKIIASVLTVAFAVSMAGSAGAVTLEELQAQFNDLLAKYNLLLAQVEQPVTAAGYCFFSDLNLGMTSAEVTALQQGLKQNPAVYPEGLVTGYFGPLTKAAVIRFQDNFATEILSPWGLTKGTGLVGSTTRAKFNALYCISPVTTIPCAKEGEKVNRNPFLGSTNQICCPGLMESRVSKSYSICVNPSSSCEEGQTATHLCSDGTTVLERCNCANGKWICVISTQLCPISPKVLSPNGGEEWVAGQSHMIQWSKGAGVSGSIYLVDNLGGSNYIADYISPNQTSFSWDTKTLYNVISGSLNPPVQPGNYKLRMWFPGLMLEVWSNTFSIVAAAPSITVLSPNGGEKWEQGKTYEIKWTGGSEKISIVLIDKSLEPLGASISKSWTIDNINNTGSYSFTVPTYLKGTFKFYLRDNSGNYAYSNYFSIVTATTTIGSKCTGLNTILTNAYGSECGDAKYNKVADVDNNKKIDFDDLMIFAMNAENETWCKEQLEKIFNPCDIPSNIGAQATKLLAILTNAYGSECGDAKYNPIADLGGYLGDPVKDGKVDFEDLMIFATNAQNEAWCKEQLENTSNPCTQTTTTTTHPITASISVAPPSVVYNGSVSLYWNSSNARYCTASASPPNNQWTGIVNLSGVKNIINLTETTTFSITCSGLAESTPVSNKATVYIKSCTDSDGGKNYYKKGTTTLGSLIVYTDNCTDIHDLIEYYCENNLVKNVSFICPGSYICQDGACKSPLITTTATTIPPTTTTTTVPIRYTCNPSTWQCVLTHGEGQYDSLSLCQARCQPPTTTTTTTQPPTVSKCTELQTILYNAYGSQCGDDKYNPVADLGGYLGDPLKDGKVDFEDLMIFATNSTNEAWCKEQLQSTINPCEISLAPINSINDAISRLKASLISIAELLKR